MNMELSDTEEVRWANNLDAIHNSFRKGMIPENDMQNIRKNIFLTEYDHIHPKLAILSYKISDIAKFPLDDFIEETSYAGDTLFIGGGESEYIPVNHHVEILELFPRYDRIQKLYPEEVFSKILTLFFFENMLIS